MSETNGAEKLSRPLRAAGIAARPAACQRQSVRVALLSLAAAILLLGAAIAAVFCYRAISAGSPAAAAHLPRHLAPAAVSAAANPAPGPRRLPLRGP